MVAGGERVGLTSGTMGAPTPPPAEEPKRLLLPPEGLTMREEEVVALSSLAKYSFWLFTSFHSLSATGGLPKWTAFDMSVEYVRSVGAGG